jgi:hypothetical protein
MIFRNRGSSQPGRASRLRPNCHRAEVGADTSFKCHPATLITASKATRKRHRRMIMPRLLVSFCASTRFFLFPPVTPTLGEDCIRARSEIGDAMINGGKTTLFKNYFRALRVLNLARKMSLDGVRSRCCNGLTDSSIQKYDGENTTCLISSWRSVTSVKRGTGCSFNEQAF